VALGFSALALNNLLLVADLLVFPRIDLAILRQASTGLAIAVFLGGFLGEREA
jgi:hypothetical protein